MSKLLMLDCDGTIRRSKSGATFINDPLDQEIIPEAADAIAHYHNQGWVIVGITNQGGVAYPARPFNGFPLINGVLFVASPFSFWLFDDFAHINYQTVEAVQQSKKLYFQRCNVFPYLIQASYKKLIPR